MKENHDITILIVDDENSLRKSLVKNFELEGFCVLSASSGHEALEVVKNQKIDFVLSDVRMPEGDGVELLKNIKMFNDRIPIVLLVSGFSEHSKDEVVAMGAIDLLTKPADIDKIIGMIKNTVV